TPRVRRETTPLRRPTHRTRPRRRRQSELRQIRRPAGRGEINHRQQAQSGGERLMDTKQLNQALSKIYDDEQARIVFWNDPQQEFDRVVENLDLDGVNLVRLDQAGGIETKLRIERDEPDSKFLLYAPEEEPEFEDDILLD